MIRITDMHGDRKGQGHQAALGGCSSHHLQGAGPLQAAQLVNQNVVKTRNNVSTKTNLNSMDQPVVPRNASSRYRGVVLISGTMSVARTGADR